MSYEKVKNIRVDRKNMLIHFENKSNNDTSAYRENSCDIPTFLHNALGNIFQFSHKKINAIVSDCSKSLSELCNMDDLWMDADSNGYDDKTAEIRSIFYSSCDKISNI